MTHCASAYENKNFSAHWYFLCFNAQNDAQNDKPKRFRIPSLLETFWKIPFIFWGRETSPLFFSGTAKLICKWCRLLRDDVSRILFAGRHKLWQERKEQIIRKVLNNAFIILNKAVSYKTHLSTAICDLLAIINYSTILWYTI
jgi:hypothetical protein